jgi:hypothetical protein
MGRVFNPLSQAFAPGLTSDPTSPDKQREQLWAFLSSHVQRLDRFLTEGQAPDFPIALLRLTRALVAQGFFEAESRVCSGERPVTRTSRRESWDSVAPPASVATPAAQLPAPIGLLGRCPTWSGVPRALSCILARGRSSEDEELSYVVLESSLILTLNNLSEQVEKSGQGTSFGLEDLLGLQQHFDSIFQEPRSIQLKTEILDLLRLLQDVRGVQVRHCAPAFGRLAIP